jgi:hypothetical protein
MNRRDIDFESADVLAHEIVDLINRDDDREHPENLIALLTAISSVLAGIECGHCRAQAVRQVEKLVPRFLKQALAEPTNSEHRH